MNKNLTNLRGDLLLTATDKDKVGSGLYNIGAPILGLESLIKKIDAPYNTQREVLVTFMGVLNVLEKIEEGGSSRKIVARQVLPEAVRVAARIVAAQDDYVTGMERLQTIANDNFHNWPEDRPQNISAVVTEILNLINAICQRLNTNSDELQTINEEKKTRFAKLQNEPKPHQIAAMTNAGVVGATQNYLQSMLGYTEIHTDLRRGMAQYQLLDLKSKTELNEQRVRNLLMWIWEALEGFNRLIGPNALAVKSLLEASDLQQYLELLSSRLAKLKREEEVKGFLDQQSIDFKRQIEKTMNRARAGVILQEELGRKS